MKRSFLFVLAALLVLACLSLMAAHNAIPTVSAGADCNMANLDCGAKADAQNFSCLQVANFDGTITLDEYKGCQSSSLKIYTGCMDAWGCKLAPRVGPGSN